MEFDFSIIAGHVVEVLSMVIMIMITWAVKWAKSKFESDVMKTNMDRLGETVRNGVRRAIHEGENQLQGKIRVIKPKSAVINSALRYVRENSPELIKRSGYSMEKIERMIESKLPEIALDYVEVVENVESVQDIRERIASGEDGISLLDDRQSSGFLR